MNWIRGSWAVLQKDLKLEMRSRYALNMLLMFVLSSLLLIAFAIGLGIGDVDAHEVDDFEIQFYWYIVFSIPLFFALL